MGRFEDIPPGCRHRNGCRQSWSFPRTVEGRHRRASGRSVCVYKKFHNGSNRIYISRAGSTSFRCGKRWADFFMRSVVYAREYCEKKMSGTKKTDNDASLEDVCAPRYAEDALCAG